MSDTSTIIGEIIRVGRVDGSVNLEVFGDAETNRAIFLDTGSSATRHRWAVYVDDVPEGGSNAGSGFWVTAFKDDGSGLADALFIPRDTCNVILGGVYGTIPADRGGVLQVLGKPRTETSGTTHGVQILPVYNQTSGTAANTDLQIDRTVAAGGTAVGSGPQKFIELSVNSAIKFHVFTNGNVGCAALACSSLAVSSLGGTIEVGAPDSGGSGYRMLRVPN